MPGLGQPTQSPLSVAWVLPGPLPVSGHLSGSRHQGGCPAALGASPRPQPLASPEIEPAGREQGAPTQRGSRSPSTTIPNRAGFTQLPRAWLAFCTARVT